MPSLKHLSIWGGLALVLATLGCATPGAPQPPSLRLPEPVQNLSAERKGTRVVLTWTQPTRTTDRQNIRHPLTTRICRATGEFPMAICREVVKQLTPIELTSQSAPSSDARSKVIYEDVLPPSIIGSQAYATYAVEVLNTLGKSAGLSNQVPISLAPTLPPPSDLRVDVAASGPVLHWTGVSRSQLGPAWQPFGFSYRVYRRVPGQPNYLLIGNTRLAGPEYAVPDSNFEWEKTYEYKVAPVTEVPAASGHPPAEIEGDDSLIVTATVHDTFPPARPTGLQAVNSGVGRSPFIDLTWAPNMESDLAGYIVYRHESGQPPVALNRDLLKSPAYRDDAAEAGHTYWYSVQAVDVRGNKSEPSEETSETVPKEQP